MAAAAPPVPVAAVPTSAAPMLGVVPTSAGPSRARIRTEFDRVNKETFVENMLRQTANALASDAEFGNNSANKIRDRVEDLADEMAEEDPVTGLPEKSAGRAVVEARFALGGDNGQYMSQAVAMLWAGDGGERLRIVPTAMMPEIMRHASAEGIIRAMRGVMVQSKATNTTKINTGLELAAWMMEVEEIRVAVVDYMIQTGIDEVVTAAATVNTTYAAGTGTQWVMSVLEVSDDVAANYSIAKAIVEAIYALTDVGAYPMRVVETLLSASKRVVDKTYSDTALVAYLGMVLGSEIEGWMSYNDTDVAGNDAFCPAYDAQGRRVPLHDGARPFQSQFQTAVAAACSRMGSTHATQYTTSRATDNVAVNDTSSTDGWRKWDPPANPLPAGKEWYLERTVTPVWNQRARAPGVDKGRFYEMLGDGVSSFITTPAEVSRRNATVGQSMRNVFETYIVMSTDPTVPQIPGDLPRTNIVARSMQLTDSWMIDFCILRGLCGYKGPHQSLPAGDPQQGLLPYNYPVGAMETYYSAGAYATQTPDIKLSAEARAEIATVLNKGYASLEPRQSGDPPVELDTDFVGYAIKTTVGDGSEQARAAHWAPIRTAAAAAQAAAQIGDNPYEQHEIEYSPMALNICEASIYEFMVTALKQRVLIVEPRGAGVTDFAKKQARTLRAAAAAAKIRQLQCMAFIAVEANDPSTMIKKPSDSPFERLVTRPGTYCATPVTPAHRFTTDNLLLPVDAGIARFVTDQAGAAAPTSEPTIGNAPANEDAIVMERGGDVKTISSEQLSSWLRRGVEKGWEYEPDPAPVGAPDPNRDVRGRPDRFSLRLDISADTQEYTRISPQLGDWQAATPAQFSWIAPVDISFENINKVAAHAVKSSTEVVQLLQEEAYITRLETDGSPERQGVFGLNTDRTVEDASRSRRADVWSDAMREVAVSGDRLYRFVTAVTGAIGESADSAISWEDEDLKQLAKDAATRQKALSERVSRFQTKLVESVVSSTLKGSKLQLDMRGKTADDQQLVVLSADVKDSIRQITDGEAGHGFFEASVEINEALGRSARPMTIHEIVANLQNVSQAFHNQVAASMAPSSGASYARITEPRNSFMLHLKPDTLAAIQKAYDYIVSEMRHCGGYHRPINLWEFVEGKDWVMCTRFAELVGLMLQNTRMRSGSFAAYVGTPQLIANGHNIRMQIQRLRTQVCYYLHTQMDMPMWLFPDGRTYYFGGTPKRHITPAMAARDVKRQKTYDAGADFGGDDGDDRFDRPDKAPRMPIIRRDVLNRLFQITRIRRNEMRRLIMEGRPLPLQQTSLQNMLDYLDDPKRFSMEFGVSRGDALRMSVQHIAQATQAQTRQQNQLQLLALIGNVATSTATATSTVTSTCSRIYSQNADRPLGKSLCEQLLDPNHVSAVKKRPLKVSSDNVHLEQPFEASEQIFIKGKRYNVVRVDIRGGSSATKPPMRFQKLQGNQHNDIEEVIPEVNKALNQIFAMDPSGVSPARRWRPHPNFKDLDAAPTGEYQNLWIKPYNYYDLQTATACRSVFYYVNHLIFTHKLTKFSAMSLMGSLLMAGYIGDPALYGQVGKSFQSDGLVAAARTAGGQAGAALNPLGDGLTGAGALIDWDNAGMSFWTENREQFAANVVNGAAGGAAGLVGLLGRMSEDAQGGALRAWKRTSFGSPEVPLKPDEKQARDIQVVAEIERRWTSLNLRRSAADTVLKSIVGTHPVQQQLDQASHEAAIKAQQSSIALMDAEIEFWKPIWDPATGKIDPAKITPEHRRKLHQAVVDGDTLTSAFCATRDEIITGECSAEFDSARDVFNGALKGLEAIYGPAFDSFWKNIFTFGGNTATQEQMEAGLSTIISTLQAGDQAGIDAHRLLLEDVPTTIYNLERQILQLERDRMRGRSSLEEDSKDRDYYDKYWDDTGAMLQKQSAFYFKYGGQLAVAQGKGVEYPAKVEEVLQKAYASADKDGVSFDDNYFTKMARSAQLLWGRTSGNSQTMHEINYKSQSDVAKLILSMKEDQRIVAAKATGLSYAAINKRWEETTKRTVNFGVWAKGEGRPVVYEQLERLWRGSTEGVMTKAMIEQKIDEIGRVENNEDAFGIFMQFVVDGVRATFERNAMANLNDLFPLGEEGDAGTRGKAAAILTADQCGDLWGPGGVADDSGVCAWPYAAGGFWEAPGAAAGASADAPGAGGPDGDTEAAEALRQELGNSG